MRKLYGFIIFLVVLSACAAVPPSRQTASPVLPSGVLVTSGSSATGVPSPTATLRVVPTDTLTPTGLTTCNLQPLIAPTKPAVIPPSLQLDETTGLHMTGVVQELDLASYRLKVGGMVDHPLSLMLDELRCMPKVTASAVLACYGIFVDSATWAGVPLSDVLRLAGVKDGAKTVQLVGADDYKVSIPLAEALMDENFLAYEFEGKPVPILHGFPLRAVFPNQPGNQWVKWLVEIVVG